MKELLQNLLIGGYSMRKRAGTFFLLDKEVKNNDIYDDLWDTLKYMRRCLHYWIFYMLCRSDTKTFNNKCTEPERNVNIGALKSLPDRFIRKIGCHFLCLFTNNSKSICLTP